MAAESTTPWCTDLWQLPVEQQLFAGGEQRLENDLVRGRGAVGRKKVRRAPKPWPQMV